MDDGMDGARCSHRSVDGFDYAVTCLDCGAALRPFTVNSVVTVVRKYVVMAGDGQEALERYRRNPSETAVAYVRQEYVDGVDPELEVEPSFEDELDLAREGRLDDRL